MRFKSILLAVTVLVVSASCSKDKDEPPASSYPKTVSVEYRVSSPSGLTTAAQIIYKNETGGMTILSNTALSFSKKISLKVNQYDNVSLSVSHSSAGTVKLDILVDNALVKSQEFTGSPVISGTIPYAFQ